MQRKKILLITGANGFIGHALVSQLSNMPEYEVHASVRKKSKTFPPSVRVFETLDLSPFTDWTSLVTNVECIIHCAARVHIMIEKENNPLAEFRRINVDTTLNLARQAALHGVKRFVFLSSIGVNGAQTYDTPYRPDDTVHPHLPYAKSKYEAEIGLQEISKKTGLSIVIIRPPLVYGAHAPGNFGKLLSWINRSIPLPLGAIHNKKSFVFVDNLVDLIIKCIEHPQASNEIFLVSDDEDISTTQLLKKLGQAFKKKPILISVPPFILNMIAHFLGKKKTAQQLLASLQVDISKTKKCLNWKPPFSVHDALKKTANLHTSSVSEGSQQQNIQAL